MGKMDLLGQSEITAVADASRRSCPFAGPVKRKHRGRFERRGIECRCRMAEMVLSEKDLFWVGELVVDLRELVAQQVLLKQLLADPDRHRLSERSETLRREGEVGFQQPLEFEERLVIESDVVDATILSIDLLKTPAGRVGGEARIVLLAREAL